MSIIDIGKSKLARNTNFFGVGDSKDGALENTDPEFIPKPSGTGIIDVVNDFCWYTGPKSDVNALNKVPRALIIERRQVLNSLVSGALYYLNVLKRTGKAGAKKALGEEAINKMQSYLQKINESSSKGKIDTKKIEDSLRAKDGDEGLLKNNNLLSLVGIYYTELTGFKYVLPYFNNIPEIGNTWSSGGEGTVAELVNSGMDAIDEISKLTNIAQPGVYIEKPKYFDFENQGKSVSVNFPLFNTINRGTGISYQDNYELLWLLIFQNKPYKTSFARTAPPKIYTVNIPGVYSMPYAYISSLSIDFRGTVRRLNVNVPQVQGDTKSFKPVSVPVPEAYVVNVTFTSLLNDYGNTMVGNSFTSSVDENKVTFGAGA